MKMPISAPNTKLAKSLIQDLMQMVVDTTYNHLRKSKHVSEPGMLEVSITNGKHTDVVKKLAQLTCRNPDTAEPALLFGSPDDCSNLDLAATT